MWKIHCLLLHNSLDGSWGSIGSATSVSAFFKELSLRRTTERLKQKNLKIVRCGLYFAGFLWKVYRTRTSLLYELQKTCSLCLMIRGIEKSIKNGTVLLSMILFPMKVHK